MKIFYKEVAVMPLFMSLVDGTTGFNVVNEFKSILTLATDALNWIGDNDVMKLIFVCGITGSIFAVIKRAKRAVK